MHCVMCALVVALKMLLPAFLTNTSWLCVCTYVQCCSSGISSTLLMYRYARTRKYAQ
jgi:uncharacterized membrane protein